MKKRCRRSLFDKLDTAYLAISHTRGMSFMEIAMWLKVQSKLPHDHGSFWGDQIKKFNKKNS